MKKTENILQKNIDDVEMPTPLKNALKGNGITKILQITAMNILEVKMMKNFGAKRIELLNEFLSENDLSLRMGF